MKQSITLIFAAVIFFLPKSTFSQETTRILDGSSDPDEIAVLFYKSTTKAVDKLFVSENWSVGEISMSDGVLIKGFPIKYDLLSKRLEIRLNNEELVQTINRIEWFKMTEKFLSRERDGKY